MPKLIQTFGISKYSKKTDATCVTAFKASRKILCLVSKELNGYWGYVVMWIITRFWKKEVKLNKDGSGSITFTYRYI